MMEALETRLRATEADRSWKPIPFQLAKASDRKAIARLLSEHPDVRAVDTIDSQLNDLARTQLARKNAPEAEVKSAKLKLLDGRSRDEYGTWFYFPWRRLLVHNLPAQHYRLLRLNRNLHMITEDEQRQLLARTVVIAGLSVGRAALSTLVAEGIGGTFRLCDFDALDVSNLNRLRGGVTDVGVSKAILAAREVAEQDPYMNVEVFDDGVTRENVDRILDGASLLVEECDDLPIKLLLREKARERRIPVIMETSDRGMLDVERYDTEPERPPFHGLIGDISAAQLDALSTKERVPFVLRIVDGRKISTRMGASLTELEETAYTWPQLASSVNLGGALVARSARLILLGQQTCSGRTYVDLDELLSDTQLKVPHIPARSERAPCDEAKAERELPSVPGVQPELTEAAARFLVAHAIWAPSGGNSQPWRFERRGGSLRCAYQADRAASFLDMSGFGRKLALGAAIENMCIAAGTVGLQAEVMLADLSDTAADLHFRPTAVQEHPLRAQIPQRVTNRGLTNTEPLPAGLSETLAARAHEAQLELKLLTNVQARVQAAAVLGELDRLRLLIEPYHRELFAELRWDHRSVLETRTGLDIHSLELSEADMAGISVMERWDVCAFLRAHSLGGASRSAARRAAEGCSAIGLVSAPSSMGTIEGGRRLQRLWLEATRLGLALHPWAPGLAMLARAETGDGLSTAEANAIRGQMEHLFSLWAMPEGQVPLFMFRAMHKPKAVAARSLRLPVSAVLT